MTGDGINIAIKASTDAHLYIGYCDRDRKLMIFPQVGSIEAKAGKITYAPSRGANIKLDDQLGPEVLYVIGSRRRLDIADPELAAAISRVRPGAANVECGEPLQQVLESKRTVPPTPTPTPAPVPALSGPRPQPAGGRYADRLPPPANLERGGYITWGPTGEVSAEGDRDDIVVLRYSFTHVAR